jgi:hypothetical protein
MGTAQDALFLKQIEGWFELSQFGSFLGPILIFMLGGIIANYVNTATDTYGNSLVGFTAIEFVLLLLSLIVPNPGGNFLAAILYSLGLTLSFTAKPLTTIFQPIPYPPGIWIPATNIVTVPATSTISQWLKAFNLRMEPFIQFGPKLGTKMVHKTLSLLYLMAVKTALLSVVTTYTLTNSITGATVTVTGTLS